jgi:hypothetical protein
VDRIKEDDGLDGGKLFLQLLKICFGFILAVLACGLFLAWGFFRAGHPDEDPVAFAAMVGTGLVGASVVGATSLLPAGLLIALAEAARLRGLIFHVAAAGAVAFLVWSLGGPEAAAGEGPGLRPGSAVALAAGFLAGLVYWLVAGRTSGCWHGSREKEL